ncbi:MAG: HD domain-containing protein [PVC group bacterium]|nr:HD domain-containing protein [PVC group bacterium]
MSNTVKITATVVKEFKDDFVFKKIGKISRLLNKEVYLVGGAVRDLFIKKNVKGQIDWDFAINKGALDFADKLARELGASFIVLDKVNKIARIVYKKKSCSYELDFADFRALNLKEDLKRRDFTINTLCVNTRDILESSQKSIQCIDYFNASEDIRKRYIRITRRQNFKDDPLRVLRGVAFSAQLGFVIVPETMALIKRHARDLKYVAAERISEELVKVFTVPYCSKYVVYMDQLKIIENIFPEICALRGVDQGGYHHLDVWDHSLEALVQLEKLIGQIEKKIPRKYVSNIQNYLNEEVVYGRPRIWLLKLSALLHDIAKPSTKIVGEDGFMHFYTHERVGAEITEDIGLRLKLSLKEIAVLKNLVRFHLRPGQIVNRIPSKRAKFRFFRDAKENAVLIILLTIADRWAMRGVLSRKKSFVFLEDELFKMIVEFFYKKTKKGSPIRLLDGNGIMETLGISPGPLVGDILAQLEEAQAVGNVKNKKEAKKFVRQIYGKETE